MALSLSVLGNELRDSGLVVVQRRSNRAPVAIHTPGHDEPMFVRCSVMQSRPPIRERPSLITHRQTVRYRFERVREITGLDVNSTDGREKLSFR